MTGEFVCRVRRTQGRDEMVVEVEVSGETGEQLQRLYEGILRKRLGVDIAVAFVRPGALAELTGIETRQKPIRLIDERRS